MKTVRSIFNYSIPILGINFGKIGFMTELDRDDAIKKLPEYINGRVRIEERMMLEASIVPIKQQNVLHTCIFLLLKFVYKAQVQQPLQ